MAILGIDLGTSNSAAAVAVGREAVMIEPAEGATDEGMVFPSYIAFDASGSVSCIGIMAKRQFQTAADLVVRHAKRLIGRSYDYIRREIEQNAAGQGRRFLDEFKERVERGMTGDVNIRVGKTEICTYTPQEIAKFMLTKIRDDAEPQVRQLLGVGIDGAVITVPAGFDDASLRATLWAGEQVFGVGKVRLIPEPLAAAIATGVRKAQETIMVVDMGAGTTDIVVGNVIRTNQGFQWAPITQGCDDELGGLDMDYAILEHLIRSDQKEPYLRDVYQALDQRGRGRLMEAIERAKIAISTADSGQVSVVLEAQLNGQSIRKPITQTMDANIIKTIVGYKGKRSFEDRGSVVERCRALVEKSLLELADDDPERIEEVKQSIDRVLLVGGPMRMRCLYEMMGEVFAEKQEVLTAFDPLNPFPMECVGKGAALYQGDKVPLQVPHTLSIFEWGRGGHHTILSRGTPYEGEAIATTELEVEEGATWIDIITEKENVTLPNFPVREHVVKVARKGTLEITLRWDTAGCRVTFNGAGLSQTEIPSISDQTTLAEDFERQFRNLLSSAHSLRESIADPELRQKIRDMLLNNLKKSAPGDLQVLLSLDPTLAMDEWKVKGRTLREIVDEELERVLAVPEEELKRCDSLDPDYLSRLQDEEIRLILSRGYTEGAKDRAKARGVSERAYEVTRLIRSISGGRVTVETLLMVTKNMLDIARSKRITIPFVEELNSFSDQLSKDQHNRVLIANVSVRTAALADVLHDQGMINRDALKHAKWVAAQVEA